MSPCLQNRQHQECVVPGPGYELSKRLSVYQGSGKCPLGCPLSITPGAA